MKKWFCDRCGNEVENFNIPTLYIGEKTTIENIPKYIFCVDCWKVVKKKIPIFVNGILKESK